MNPTTAPRFCIVIPTYNNARTIRDVIEGARREVPDIIVVDDGCTDDTGAILRAIPAVQVVTFPTNRGKGAALAAGMERAAELGFTHAITVDSDGQHDTTQIPRLIELASLKPDAIILGARHLPPGVRRARKTARTMFIANTCSWLLTGHWLADTQTGFRVYPLAQVLRLYLKTRRYEYETEIIVKGIWMRLEVASVPITATYGPGSESHFRQIQDTFWWVHLTSMLIWQRMLFPASVRSVMHLRESHALPRRERWWMWIRGAVLQDCSTPAAFALCVAIGVLCGILPIWGFQMATAAAIAHRLHLSKPVAIAASNISFGFMMPAIIFASLVTGRLLLSGRLDLDVGALPTDGPVWWRWTFEYLVGSVVFGLLMSLLAGAIAYFVATSARRLKAGTMRGRHA